MESKNFKQVIVLYNPPATQNINDWNKPIPINLLSICSMIDDQKFEIVISQELPDKAFKDIKDKLNRAICFGFSCMTGTQISNGLELAKKIKTENSNIPVLIGGYHPTATPEQTLQHQLIDIVVRGYGEISFSEIIKRLRKKESYEDIPGISYKKNGKIFHNPDGPIPNLNDLPPLPYHLFDVEKFLKDTNSRTLHYISSRGCPHHCGFCADFVIYKRRWNSLSAERVVSDLEKFQKIYKYNSVRFYDSNLFVDEKRIKSICESIIKKKLHFKWINCNGDAFGLCRYSLDTLKIMKQAGVSNVLIGVESGYEPALKCIDKAASIEHNIKAIKLLHANNISVGFSFIFGFPYLLSKEELKKEHQKEFMATMKAIVQFNDNYMGGDYYLFFIFTPFPGVRLFPDYIKLGYVPPNSLEEWSKINLNETNSCPWIDQSLIKDYKKSLDIIWLITYRPLNYNFPFSENLVIKKFISLLDKKIQKTIKKNIYRGDLSLPLTLRLVKKIYERLSKLIKLKRVM